MSSCDDAAAADGTAPNQNCSSPGMESPLKIRVLRGLSSRLVCDVQLSKESMVWEIKFAVAKESGMYWRMQRLFLEGRVLEDGEVLEDILGSGSANGIAEVSLVSVQVKHQPSLNDARALFGIVGQDGMALQYAGDPDLRDDTDIVLWAVSQNPDALAYASNRLRSDKALVLRAVSQNGRALRHATPPCRSDKNIVLAAINQDALAIANATRDLRRIKEIVRVALQKNPKALQYVDPNVVDENDTLDAVARDSSALSHACRKFTKNRDFILRAVACNGISLEHVPAFSNDKDVVLAAVAQNGNALRAASSQLRADKDVVLRAVSQRCTAIRFAEPCVATDAEVKAAVVQTAQQKRLAAGKS